MPRIYRTNIESEADLKILVTTIRSVADLVVYETASPWEATEPGIWCYVEVRGEAERVVHFTDAHWDADLVVFRTGVQSDAGWLNADRSGLL